MKYQKFSKLTFLFVWLASTQLALASIPVHEQYLELSKVTPIYPVEDSIFTAENFKKYCPTMTPTTDPLALAQQIEVGFSQKLTDSFFRDTLMKQPGLKSINDQVEKVTNNSLVIAPSPGKPGITHKITEC